jgi:hypothetical protein
MSDSNEVSSYEDLSMAVVISTQSIYRYSGLSTDEKPSKVDPSSIFYETDTGREYEYRDGWIHKRTLVEIANPGDIVAQAAVLITMIDEASDTITYIGEALPGTSQSAAAWRIKRIDSSSGTSILYADGDAQFDNIWANRAALSYS